MSINTISIKFNNPVRNTLKCVIDLNNYWYSEWKWELIGDVSDLSIEGFYEKTYFKLEDRDYIIPEDKDCVDVLNRYEHEAVNAKNVYEWISLSIGFWENEKIEKLSININNTEFKLKDRHLIKNFLLISNLLK